MSRIGRHWAGKLYGTNTGNLSVELDSSGSDVTGIIRLMDDRFGLVAYSARGTFDGANVTLTGNTLQAPEGVITGTVTVEGALTPEGHLRGQWSSTLGTGGTFILFPHDIQEKSQQATTSLPEQLHVATRSLGALRLYADDVRELIAFLRRDFKEARVVVTFRQRGNEISKYVEDFEKDIPTLGELRYLKLAIQEPEAYGLNRLASVQMDAIGVNEVRVQGIQESWVIGKAEALAAHLRKYEKALSTSFRKFGLNINALLVLAVLVLLPDLSLAKRIIFLALVVAVASLVVHLHARYIPNAVIHLSTPAPSLVARAGAPFVSWFIAVSAAVVASVAYGLLKGNAHELASWFMALF